MSAQMFIVVATKGADQIGRAVEEEFGTNDSYALREDVWLIPFDGTTRQLAERLGIRQGTNGSGLVAPLAGYSGRASSELWEWFKARWPQDG
jgi:hypothetical protein